MLDILSVATSTPPFELPSGAQYGILGILVAALASGRFVVPRYVLDRERERADRMELENVRVNTLIQEKAIPALVDASSAVKESITLIHDLRHERDLRHEIEGRQDK